MIRFNRLLLLGFKDSERKLDLCFSDESVSVIYGENGSGKTTLLRVLHAILSQDEHVLLNERIRDCTVFFTADGVSTSVHIYRINESESEDDESNKEVFHYDWKEFEQSALQGSTSILFGVNRGTPSTFGLDPMDLYQFISRHREYASAFSPPSRLSRFSDEFSAFVNTRRRLRRNRTTRELNFQQANLSLDSIQIDQVQNLIEQRYRLAKRVTSERVQKALFDTLSLAITPKTEREEGTLVDIDRTELAKLITENKKRLIEALMDTAENKLRNELIDILQNPSLKDGFERFLSNNLLSQLLFTMVQELKEEESILQSITILQDMFNTHLSKGKRMIIDDDGIYVQLQHGRHSLSDLSSGERHLLTVLTVLIIEGTNKDFLMIDEPELSLNIRWQRELIKLLVTLSPHTQIILASHSPSIAKSNTKSLVEMS